LLIMVPVSRYAMLACADELRRRRPTVFGRCSRRLVRALCRPYWQAGWCNRDILHALDYRPSMFSPLGRELAIPDRLASPRQLIVDTAGSAPGATASKAMTGSSQLPLKVRVRVGERERDDTHGWLRSQVTGRCRGFRQHALVSGIAVVLGKSNA
jgi:hypothetical protein